MQALRVHQYHGLAAPGPRLIVLGAVHGNEVGGTRAIERVIAALDASRLVLERGMLTLVPITNPLAYQRRERQGERNLNRGLAPKRAPTDFEDRIANVLCPLLAAHDVLLDLHSFHTAGRPFVMLGPPDNQGALEPFAQGAAEARLAAHLGPRRIVEGWMDAYARGVRRRQAHAASGDPRLCDVDYGVGTTEYMRRVGGYGVTLECGQHDDPAAPEVAHAAILQALALLGLADLPLAPTRDDYEVLRLVDVIDRGDAGDRFERAWSSFDPVAAGERIGVRVDGTPVSVPEAGFIVFPNPNALPGAEWFYFAQPSVRRL